MRDLGSEIRTTIVRDELHRTCTRAWIALQDAEHAEDVAAKGAVKAKDAADRARLELGRALVAKKQQTKHGQWAAVLADLGIVSQRASELMRLAGHVEANPRRDDSGGDLVPSMREAGIKRDAPKPAPAAIPDDAEEPDEDDEPAPVAVAAPVRPAPIPSVAIARPVDNAPPAWAVELERHVTALRRAVTTALGQAEQIEALMAEHEAVIGSRALMTTRSMVACVKSTVADLFARMEPIQ